MRAADLARALCQVPAMSLDQVARGFARGDPANARKLLRGRGFAPVVVLGKDLRLDGPVARWRPGEPAWDFGAVSYRLVTRWAAAPARPVRAYVATRKAHGLYGGTPQKLGVQAAHHLGVAEIWLTLREQGRLDGWRLEDGRFTPQRDKRPDAHLGETLIDFGGHYGPARVRELWTLASEGERPIEVW